MHNLFISCETYTNGYRVEFLDLSSLTSVLSGILVIVSKNPIVSVLCLIALFLSISSYLITLGLSFIGLSYLLVYVGAVSILFLFILMLINVRVSELLNDTSNSIPLAVLVVIPFNYAVYQVIPYSMSKFNNYNLNLNDYFIDVFYNSYGNYLSKVSISFESKYELGFVTGKAWDSNLSEVTHITSIGNVMYTSYSIWLVITSIILLLAMVGSIVITIKQKN